VLIADSGKLRPTVEAIIMDITECEVIQLELKYCERCGGLWLRRRGTAEVYCAACAQEMPGFRMVRQSKARARLPIRNAGEIRRRFELIPGLGNEGGMA
jgi:Zn-finger nucleic acid-binding protein